MLQPCSEKYLDVEKNIQVKLSYIPDREDDIQWKQQPLQVLDKKVGDFSMEFYEFHRS